MEDCEKCAVCGCELIFEEAWECAVCGQIVCDDCIVCGECQECICKRKKSDLFYAFNGDM